jgi:hypothetical protein
MVEEWEVRVVRSEGEFDDKLSEAMKVAILIQMLPKEMQDMVFPMGSLMGGREKLDYRETRDKVVSVEGKRAEQRRPNENEVMAAWPQTHWDDDGYGGGYRGTREEKKRWMWEHWGRDFRG